jgi:predicted ATP-grasp superfamily ATP-dependent carboligase
MATVSKTWAELDEADLGLCPGIYQHQIPGQRHLRINCYGDDVVAFAIETEIMDWRRDHSAATTHVALDPGTEQLCRELIAGLGLRMGVIDAKVLDNGSPCFLEVNPQGQFLFLEAATGFDLTGACAAFLHRQAGLAD